MDRVLDKIRMEGMQWIMSIRILRILDAIRDKDGQTPTLDRGNINTRGDNIS